MKRTTSAKLSLGMRDLKDLSGTAAEMAVRLDAPHHARIEYDQQRCDRVYLNVGAAGMMTAIGDSHVSGTITLKAAKNLHTLLGSALAELGEL